MASGAFVTAINCMDGRTQLPVNEWLRGRFGVDFVDTITEPGPLKILAEAADAALVESIRRRVEISVLKHGSRVVAIVGHHDCAGNPQSKDVQLGQLALARRTVEGWKLAEQVVLLWVGAEWSVELVRTED